MTGGSPLGDAVLNILDAVMADTPQPSYRDQGGLSMSALGGCRRKGAYLAARTPADREGSDSRAAEVGTALHAQWLPRLAQLLGGRAEVEVELNGVPGTIDLLLPEAVVDLKTVNRAGYDFLREPRRSWRMQVTAGALACDRALCAVLVVCRDTGRAKWFQWPTADYEEELYDWLGDADNPPEQVARDFRGPGIDRQCDWCQFAYTCWPDQPPAAPQAVMVHDDADTERMLGVYREASAVLARAEKDKAFARACLSGSPDGVYGRWQLRWRRSAGRERLDDGEARRLLEELGMPVPVKVGDPSTAIDVREVEGDP